MTALLIVMYWQGAFGVVGATCNWFLDSPRLGRLLDYNLIALWFITLPTLLEQLS